MRGSSAAKSLPPLRGSPSGLPVPQSGALFSLLHAGGEGEERLEVGGGVGRTLRGGGLAGSTASQHTKGVAGWAGAMLVHRSPYEN